MWRALAELPRRPDRHRRAGILADVKDLARLLRRIAVTVVGTVILAVGVVLLVAPGPGLVVIALALAVFAIEYQWARRHLATVQAHARSRAGQWQQVGEYQHNAEADGANAEKDGGGGGNAAGCRLESRRPGTGLHGDKVAPGPLVLDGEHGQRQGYHYQARPGRYQEHHTDGEDHRANDGDRDPAEQPNQVLHVASMSPRGRRSGI